MTKKKKRREFTREFKAEAVKLVREQGLIALPGLVDDRSAV
jgi:transposase-like protein